MNALSTLHIAAVLREQPYPATNTRDPAQAIAFYERQMSACDQRLGTTRSDSAYADKARGEKAMWAKMRDAVVEDCRFAEISERLKASEQRTRDWIAEVEARS